MASKIFVLLSFLGVVTVAVVFLSANKDMVWPIVIMIGVAFLVLGGIASQRRRGTQVTSAAPGPERRAAAPNDRKA